MFFFINDDDGSKAKEHLKGDSRYMLMGWCVTGIGLLGFLVWSAFAPLDKGVTSTGTVTVSGNRKTVQAPTGGIIKDITVKEGERVNAGDVLVKLSPVQAQAQFELLEDQYHTMLATEARLLAERDGLIGISFPSELRIINNNPRITEILTLQSQLFMSRHLAIQTETEGIRQLMEGINYQLKGLKDSLANKNIQLSGLREQAKSLKQLASEGYVPRNRYLEMRNQVAEINSHIDETRGRIGLLEKQLQESGKRIEQRMAGYQQEVRTQLATTQVEVSELRSKLEMARFELGKTSIISPTEGTVVGLNIFTPGGVVSTGEYLMDIVPGQADMVVDSRLRVDLIDKIYDGLPVDLMFTALNQNKTPKIPGVVKMVSADRLTDKTSGESYYQVRIAVTSPGMDMLREENIKPGMPVEVFIKTGTRSLLSYLFKPVLDRTSTSLTEE
ncbi:HlyD family type I secretion periplasmic adaptor subunit [Salmonella enterica]|nr:HlyD family type I secretion periplasmic adaptor subunit [Salmonella enterica]ELX2843774.1 HlyD family type I secretion periplasmic adaptor subunit [Salmonella enterica]